MKAKKTAFFSIIVIVTLLFGSCSSRSKTTENIQIEPPPSQPEIQKAQESTAQEKKESPPELAIPPAAREENIMETSSQDKETYPEKEDISSLLEQALYAYQDALFAWENNDPDAALGALDEAYSLILRVKLPGDSPLLQEKNDLRLLIAQRIQQIYASRLVTVGDNHKTIPLEENKYVLAEIESFQTKEMKYFEESYMRSGLYREMIIEELRKAGLPEELSWLPMIESWFKVRALSKARALGMWQFIPSTGYRFGLKRDRWVDERMDPQKSTAAAVKYLSDLHSLFGDWTTALAAYNCGEIRVQNVIRTQHVDYLDNFWDLYARLPLETARFVPRFIAAVLIIKNPEKYGFSFSAPYPSVKYETVRSSRPVKISSLASSLGLDTAELTFLNPELRYDATPEYDYDLRVPWGYGEKVPIALNSLPRWIPPEATYVWHSVRKGETLSTIAQRYRTSVAAIARLNGLKSVNVIRPGQRLKIPGRGTSISSRSTESSGIAPNGKVDYTVEKGDTLAHLARIYNTSIKKIKTENSLRNDILSIGQKLVIRPGLPEGSVLYKVNSGDTLFGIAKKYDMSLEEFLQINGLHSDSTIYPGQELWVVTKDN